MIHEKSLVLFLSKCILLYQSATYIADWYNKIYENSTEEKVEIIR